MASNCSSCYPCGCFSPAPAPAGPTGPTGPTGPAAITAYGGIYSPSPLSLTLTTGYQRLALSSQMAGQNIGFDLATTSIIISTPGDYEIIYSLSYQDGPISPERLELAVLVNSSPIDLSVAGVSLDDDLTDSVHRLTNVFIYGLEAGDRLELSARATDAGFESVFTEARMTAKRVG